MIKQPLFESNLSLHSLSFGQGNVFLTELQPLVSAFAIDCSERKMVTKSCSLSFRGVFVITKDYVVIL